MIKNVEESMLEMLNKLKQIQEGINDNSITNQEERRNRFIFEANELGMLFNKINNCIHELPEDPAYN
jgi:hypothetical protein